jgi:hypothetical protein
VKKDRDEALERVGRWLYGALWPGELNESDWKIGRRYERAETRLKTPVSLPKDPKKALRNARADFRSHASAFQYWQVGHWLWHEHALDMTVAGFDSAKFEAWFRKNIGVRRGTVTETRKTAVENVLRRVGRPGRGGSIGWKELYRHVRKECGKKWTDQTIKRDVDEILRRSGK